MDLSFYKDKKVLVTGHTGFKGSWMCKALVMSGAQVIGYSLEPPTEPSLYKIANLEKHIISMTGDIRDIESVKYCVNSHKPDIVIHMAAQPIVRESYSNPVYTYETNVMGTVNILEAVRLNESIKSFINVTTDKVYQNNEWMWGYRENDRLDGYDPYSNSKSCAELVTSTYKKSFFNDRGIAISTCRAGNVIGGGDFAKDRIIPDCIRAMKNNDEIVVRNPNSTRPYQHVLEPVYAYLLLAQMQYVNIDLQGNYNVGPDDKDCITTGRLVDIFCKLWSENARWSDVSEPGAPHEANYLKLDCSKIKNLLSWKPKWGINEALEKTIEWSKVYYSGDDINPIMEKQIVEYLKK